MKSGTSRLTHSLPRVIFVFTGHSKTHVGFRAFVVCYPYEARVLYALFKWGLMKLFARLE